MAENKLASIAQGATTVRAFSYDGAGNITADTHRSTTYHYRGFGTAGTRPHL
jgi:YD repeat-containing protein